MYSPIWPFHPEIFCLQQWVCSTETRSSFRRRHLLCSLRGVLIYRLRLTPQIHPSQQELTSNLLIYMAKSSAKDHPWPLPYFKYSWVFIIQNALRVEEMLETHGLVVFLVARSLLRSEEQDAKDFRLNCERPTGKDVKLSTLLQLQDRKLTTLGAQSCEQEVGATRLPVLTLRSVAGIVCTFSVVFWSWKHCGCFQRQKWMGTKNLTTFKPA